MRYQGAPKFVERRLYFLHGSRSKSKCVLQSHEELLAVSPMIRRTDVGIYTESIGVNDSPTMGCS